MEVINYREIYFASGDWSDGSDLWNDDLKKKYKVLNRDDGVFYMDILEFKKYFGDVEFGYYRDHYKYGSVKANFKKNHACYFTVDVQKKGEFYITAC
jgi:Calpain family cysteine protease